MSSGFIMAVKALAEDAPNPNPSAGSSGGGPNVSTITSEASEVETAPSSSLEMDHSQILSEMEQAGRSSCS